MYHCITNIYFYFIYFDVNLFMGNSLANKRTIKSQFVADIILQTHQLAVCLHILVSVFVSLVGSSRLAALRIFYAIVSCLCREYLGRAIQEPVTA